MHLHGVPEAPASKITALHRLFIIISHGLLNIRKIINILSLIRPCLALIKQFKLIPLILSLWFVEEGLKHKQECYFFS